MGRRIAIVLPDLRGGGAERVGVNLANGFVQRGFAVDMVLLSAAGEFVPDLRPEVQIVDLQVTRLRRALLPITRYLRESRPDALVAKMWPLTVIAVWSRALAYVPTRVAVAEHATWSKAEIVTASALTAWLARITMHFTFPRANGVVAVSQGSANDLSRFAWIKPESITVIYNPVVDGSRPPCEDALAPEGWWGGTHHRVLAVGTLKAIKDYKTLLTAFAKLRRQLDARLLILGEGHDRPALEAQAKQLGIDGSVFMPGFVRDLAPYYQRADLHVLSSKGEGFGNVIVEALAAGTPVVSTDCPSGPREILCDGRYGRLVPVGDADALAAAMAESLGTTHDHEALRARAQEFSIDKAVDRYLELLFPGRS